MAGLIFDFEPWRPQSKNHREIPNDSLGIETVIGELSWEYPDRAGLPGVGAGPVGKSGVGAVIHARGVGWGDALPVAR